jgi:spore germination cell wall hydrolase CwlJ-like protein
MRAYFVTATLIIIGLFATIAGAYSQTNLFKHQLPVNLKMSDLSTPTKRQIECMAENIYFEAAHEPREGQIAVAMVTLNRLASGNYADDICGVVKQKTGHTCQFSWVCMPKFTDKRLTIKDSSLYNEIQQLAIDVVFNYGLLKDVTNGATFYHADYVNPGWNLPKSVKIGRHIFYVHNRDVESINKEITI